MAVANRPRCYPDFVKPQTVAKNDRQLVRLAPRPFVTPTLFVGVGEQILPIGFVGPEKGNPLATKRQIAANRRNARKSAGPKTPQGKATASMNALRHGLRARKVVIPGEKQERV